MTGNLNGVSTFSLKTIDDWLNGRLIFPYGFVFTGTSMLLLGNHEEVFTFLGEPLVFQAKSEPCELLRNECASGRSIRRYLVLAFPPSADRGGEAMLFVTQIKTTACSSRVKMT